ncbi:MAG: hypothetical protein IJV70_01435 [Clostridia bacterium]|nr:hypothetical protein [Clostridia bacterium]
MNDMVQLQEEFPFLRADLSLLQEQVSSLIEDWNLDLLVQAADKDKEEDL